MNNRGDKWAGLVSGYPNFFSPYWRALPLAASKTALFEWEFVGPGLAARGNQPMGLDF